MRAKHRKRRTYQKFDEDFFQILWPSQKPQTLTISNKSRESKDVEKQK